MEEWANWCKFACACGFEDVSMRKVAGHAQTCRIGTIKRVTTTFATCQICKKAVIKSVRGMLIERSPTRYVLLSESLPEMKGVP